MSRIMRVAPMAEPAPIVAARDPPVPMVVNGEAAESPYAFDRDPELVGRDLRERRLVALAVRDLPRRDRQVAGRLEPRPRGLARHVEADRR
jgi:hypothetical protein